jgi:small ligand-binding sensory domain FIST
MSFTQFPYAHATHPQWRMAAALVLAQLRAQMALPRYASEPSLGLLYITDHYAPHAQELLDHLSAELPEVTDWAGTVGVGIASNNVEYFDEPALAVMLCALPHNDYRVFSGVSPLGNFAAHTALVHADAHTPDVAELIAELAERTASGCVFGGLASSRAETCQFAFSHRGNLAGHGARSVFSGGLSGVAFSRSVPLLSRVTQGCAPVGPTREITAAKDNVIIEMDGESALDVLLADLHTNLGEPRVALAKVRETLVGLSHAGERATGKAGFGDEVIVRHIIGLDADRQTVAVADVVRVGMRAAFCQRHMQAARADLVRICAEIREELAPAASAFGAVTDEAPAGSLDALPDAANPHAPREIAGAIYISCAGRGGPHFGGDSAELQIVRRALGDVPLIGFFAGGEIAHHHLYGYTGVLTVFSQ